MKRLHLLFKSRFLTFSVKDKSRRRVLSKLLRMQESTTGLLEELRGEKLKVQTEFQKEIYTEGEFQIVRVARLYFQQPASPVIYSITSIPRGNLSPVEVEQVKSGVVPLGTIFGFSRVNSCKKSGISIRLVTDRRLKMRLNVQASACFTKEYCLWAGGRRIGVVKEIFNEESLSRIWR